MLTDKLRIVLSLLIVSSLLVPQQLPIVAGPLNPCQDVESMVSDYAFTETYWKTVAQNAWQYFRPGVAVNPDNGLHNAHRYYTGFTDWDLGSYVLAAVDMARLGLLSNDGAWGFDDRISKILTFLENRPLTSSRVPYTWYSSTDGENLYGDTQYAVDAAFLLMALKNVADYRPTFASRINTIVNVRTTYEPLKQVVDDLGSSGRPLNVYDYFTTAGFAEFWPERFSSKANIMLSDIINAPVVNYEGVALPKAKILCEPLLLSIFGLSHNADLMNLTRQVYLAHEARYNDTGKYVAFSEGNPEGIVPSYVWEWVVLPDGRTWITQSDEFTDITMTPAVFLKTAIGLASIYSTPFTQNMVNWLEPALNTAAGYFEGKRESGQTMPIISDKTNGMIINAARYAVENMAAPPAPSPSPTPTVTPIPSPTGSPSPTPSVTPSPTIEPILTPSPTATVEPSPTPSPSDTPSSTPTTTPSASPSVTPTLSPSASSSPTSSPTLSPSPSATPSATAPAPTASPSSSASASASVMPSSTASQSPEFGLPWYSDPLPIALIVVGVSLATILLVFRFRRK